jgi:hypothetical protein
MSTNNEIRKQAVKWIATQLHDDQKLNNSDVAAVRRFAEVLQHSPELNENVLLMLDELCPAIENQADSTYGPNEAELREFAEELKRAQQDGQRIAMVNSSVESGMFAEGALMDAGFRADMREMLQPSERPDKRPQLKDSELAAIADIVIGAYCANGHAELIVMYSAVGPTRTIRWNISVDDEANGWANAYLWQLEEIELVCVSDSTTDKNWNDHIDFVIECWRAGVKPTHFIDELYSSQKIFNETFNVDGDDFIDTGNDR